MDELYKELLAAKIYEKAFYLLADAILDNSKLNYNNTHLTIDEDAPAYSVIKAFYSDGYRERFEPLRKEYEEHRRAAKNADKSKEA